MTTSSLYQRVTDAIVAKLEEGTNPWSQSWSNSGGTHNILPTNAATNRPYSGINIVVLWGAAQRNSYQDNSWITYKQAHDRGFQVRKGEKATEVCYYKLRKIVDESSDKTVNIPLLRSFYVFNVDQLVNWECSAETILPAPDDSIVAAEDVVKRSECDLRHGGNQAFYIPSKDFIAMPELSRFNSCDSYYATLLHELTHWTGHKSRLNRDKPTRFGDETYAFEELVAEMGSAFLCADLGVAGQLEQHASYIDGWLKILKKDSKAIFKAASLASKAHQYLVGSKDEEGSE